MAVNVLRRSALLHNTDVSVKEDVLDLIEQLSAKADELLGTLGKSTATSPTHQWMNDTYRSTASAAVYEGADATLVALTTPTRSTNLTEIVSLPIGVSGTQQATAHYGMGNTLAYYTAKTMQEWKNAVEFDLIRSSLVSGLSGVVQKMAGVIAFISTNVSAYNSGTVFSETILNGAFQENWSTSNGETATDIYVGGVMKRVISGFSGRSGSQFVAPLYANTVANTVTKYLSDFGEHNVHLHRLVSIGGTDATDRVLGMRSDKWRIAYLRTPRIEELAKTGDSEKRQLIGELTLECLNERTNFYLSGFKRTI